MSALNTILAARAWIAVPAADVQKGDLYANHGTVTVSRSVEPGERTDGLDWCLEIGDMTLWSGKDALVIVGRPADQDLERKVVANAIGFAMFAKTGEHAVRIAPDDNDRCQAAAARALEQLRTLHVGGAA